MDRPRKFTSPRRSASRKGGFTLIEILIVISIIAILSAILFPTFARTRETARRASCASNLKFIGIGLMQYVHDYDEVMPDTEDGVDETDPIPTWVDRIQNYTISEEIFECPSAKELKYKTRTVGKYGGYGLNQAYYNYSDAAAKPPTSEFGSGHTITLSDLEVPSATVWAGDTNGSYVIGWGDTMPAIDTLAPRTLGDADKNYVAIERHAGRVNILWCDGHVKAMSLDTLAKTNGNGIASAFTIKAD